jgi:GntR family transcriptional regulator
MAMPDQRLPRYQQLHDDLVAQIGKHVWRPGEAIPNEAELAKTYEVAIGTVRKAVDVLVAEGLLERYHGKGTFVRRPRFDSSLFRFFRFQSPSGERRVPESRILQREVLEAPSAVADALRLPAATPVIRITRLRLIDQNPVLAEEIWLPKDKFAVLLGLPSEEIGDLLYPAYEQYCGQVIASATETLTVESVAGAYARLLRLECGLPIIVIERLAYGFDGQPLEWRRSRGPADQFRYQVDIR